MSYEEENSFPKEFLAKRLNSTGNMWGWKFEDIPQVVKLCREFNFAILGGQTEFFLPDGTYELYWLKADPKEKDINETWQQYVERSCSEFLQLFTELVKKTDFEKEGLEWPFLRDKKNLGVNILDYLCFEISIISDARYLKLFK